MIPDRLESMEQVSSFQMDLADAFCAADKPLFKLRHPKIQSFFKKYTDQIIPSETTLGTKCIAKLYDNLMGELASHSIFLQSELNMA